jgi:regulation of enolase protein 1 (concanavalin A-like superfamily)
MKNLNDWYIQNENPSHWSFDNGLLSMQVQEGNIFGAGSSDVDNIFIHPVSQPNYSAEITITLEPTLPFEQAGLGLYWDNNNYIKISKEMFKRTQA